jgi:hypothetical protein
LPGKGLASQSSLCPVRPDQDRYHRRPTEGSVQLTGANRFAGQDHCSRVCRAEHGRAAGAPLTVILNGKRIVGTVGRATRTDQTRRGAGDRVTVSNHILGEAGPVARRRPPCPSAPPRERARLSRRPGRGPSPANFSLNPGPGGHALASSQALRLRHSASSAPPPSLCGPGARRWRAAGAPLNDREESPHSPAAGWRAGNGK